jgi:hypothetical protein
MVAKILRTETFQALLKNHQQQHPGPICMRKPMIKSFLYHDKLEKKNLLLVSYETNDRRKINKPDLVMNLLHHLVV